ncbi:sensor histidine kinase [[Leptolyngbya] sp. PCC 7376]|uniref:sensor histidine kinase n=1 Tax=[Leptolyngbya] sp. PCC 7376 TaxID=111781 RepID=UPI001358C9BE|nr:ATP-binding protein [[Leptolyngbya] sp. PCC 7376]
MKTQIFQKLEQLTKRENALFEGGIIYNEAGLLITSFGQEPELSFNDFQQAQKTTYLNRNSYQYDVAQTLPLKDERYILIIRHDAIAIRDEFFAFNSRILGLVIIISIAVTVSTAIVLNSLVIAPILKLRGYLHAVGEAVHHHESLREKIQPTHNIQNDELGEVMVAFNDMVENIARGLEEIEATQYQLMHTEQLIHSAKMSGLEKIVAGIAHEINNPLGVVYSNIHHLDNYVAQVLKALNHCRLQQSGDKVPTSTHHAINLEKNEDVVKEDTLPTEEELAFIVQDLPELCDSMKSGAKRVRDIVLSLRDFARLDEVGCKVVDINDGLDSTLSWLTYRLESNRCTSKIDVSKEYGDLPLVECDPKQINQVFLNILMNSIDALEDPLCTTKTPKLQLRTQVVNGDCVAISFIDNGVGIPAEIQSKVFDPFFTTKSVGHGKGLGLALVDRIVTEEHKGQVNLKSSPAGTEMTVILPVKFCAEAIAK